MNLIFLVVIASSFSLVVAKYHHFEDDITLNEEQKKLLQDLKEIMEPRMPHDYMKKDIFILKWLRSRYFNVDKAEADLMKYLKWREDNNMDSILTEDFSDMEDDYKIWYGEGRDKRGKPICYYDFATHDQRKAVISGKSDRYLRYSYSKYEGACTLVRELGEKYGNITRGQLIINFEGYSLVTNGCLQCIPIILQTLTAFDQYWPECTDQFIIVNAPAVMEPLLEVGKSIVSPALRNSLQVFGSNRRHYMKVLSEEFDFDELPPSIGGTKLYSGME